MSTAAALQRWRRTTYRFDPGQVGYASQRCADCKQPISGPEALYRDGTRVCVPCYRRAEADYYGSGRCGGCEHCGSFGYIFVPTLVAPHAPAPMTLAEYEGGGGGGGGTADSDVAHVSRVPAESAEPQGW